MTIKKVTIAGGGTLGSQIAWQSAFMGFEVKVYDKFDDGLERSKAFHAKFAQLFETKRGANKKDVEQAIARLSYTTDLAEAVKDADIISESVPENPDIKQAFYSELAAVAPQKTIFTTNSSTTVPSQYAEATGRPEQFLAMHFANGIWDANIAEIMGHPGTDSAIFDRVVEFSKQIGMVPIPLHKEQPGYVINTMLVPLINASGNLLMNGVADVESIDKTWMIGTGASIGPFGMIDMIGMQTMYNIDVLFGNANSDQALLDRAAYIKENYIDKGKLGLSSGEGFYSYPNPAFKQDDFLS